MTATTTTNSIKTSISDLDAAIRALEISTNPSLRRACNCNATRHPLLTSAPNCLECGKSQSSHPHSPFRPPQLTATPARTLVICILEGLGPCPFCSAPLIPAEEVQSMIRLLREERGREKMEANNASQRRADVSRTQPPRAFTSTSTSTSFPPTNNANSSLGSSASLSAAQQHRDKLLSFQEASARRTRIIDEAADFETPSAGLSMWAGPHERALQLKRQQKVLREQEWNARPDYEKRRTVVAIDLMGKKTVVKTVLRDVERQQQQQPELDEEEGVFAPQPEHRPGGKTAGGAFTRNPLLGDLIRPVYTPAEEGKETSVGREDRRNMNANAPWQKTWRRVQDDLEDNERVILDGGIYGRSIDVEDQPLHCG
ncbi:MAG: hypothetical protein M1816_008012 [Peltula sp. TS41687]|nr:MAG: hypothetical protein M1816_008012 [Peltula sp. TS41687]